MPRCPPGGCTPHCPPGGCTPRCPPGGRTPRCPPGGCTPPSCSIYDMSLMLTAGAQCHSEYHFHSSAVLSNLVCMPSNVRHGILSLLCLMKSVLDSGVKVSCQIMTLCYLSALVTPSSERLQAVYLKNLKSLCLL